MRWFSHQRKTGGRHNCITILLTDVVAWPTATFWGVGAHGCGLWTPNSNSGQRDFCTMHLTAKFHHPTFTHSEVIVLINKQKNWRTNRRRWKHPPRSAMLCQWVNTYTGRYTMKHHIIYDYSVPRRWSPLRATWDLTSVQCWYVGPADKWFKSFQLNLLKDQYSNSLTLTVSGLSSRPRNLEIPWLGTHCCICARQEHLEKMTQIFMRQMPFLPPNQQCQSTEENLNCPWWTLCCLQVCSAKFTDIWQISYATVL